MREYPASSATSGCSICVGTKEEELLLSPKAMSVQINMGALSSRPVNCLHAGLGISETDVAGSNHVMN